MNPENLTEAYKEHKQEIILKIKEFSMLSQKNHLKELFFCILTPQSNAEKCWQAVQNLKNCRLNKTNIEACLRTKTRFYRNKTKYLIQAESKWKSISKLIKTIENPAKLRMLLTDNNSEYKIKGLGMKETSHFLRNIGKSNNHLAILDRHVLRKMKELNLINEAKIKNIRDYSEKERILKEFSNKINIPLDHLDLLFWKLESGRIFK